MSQPPNPGTSAQATTTFSATLAAELCEESLRIVPTLDLRDIGAQLLAPLVRATSASRVSLMVLNPETGRLRIVAGMGLRPELIGRDTEWRPNSISEWVLRKHQGLVLNGEIRTDALRGSAEQAIESALCVPLDANGIVMGVLNVARTAPAPTFTDADMAALQDMLPPVTAAIERAIHANRAEQLASQLRDSSGQSGRTLLKPGHHETRSYELGYVRIASALDGGDVCERVPHPQGGQALIAVDVAGDGVDAALTAAFVHGLFVATAGPDRTPVSLVQRISTEMHQRSAGRLTAALWTAQFSPTGLVTSCNAGYPPPLWVPADDSPVALLSTGGPLAGTSLQAAWEEEQVRMLPGDLVVVASDGVLGARNVTGQTFGFERLSEYVLEMRRQPLDTLVAELVRAAHGWSGRDVPTDDLCVLAVRFAPGR